MRSIYFWHGYSASLEKELLDINGIVKKEDGLVLTGPLDNFLEEYNRPVIVLSSGTLCVTQHSNFNQR